MNQFIQEHAWLYLSGHPQPKGAPQAQDDATPPMNGERAAQLPHRRTIRRVTPRRLARLTALVLRRS